MPRFTDIPAAQNDLFAPIQQQLADWCWQAVADLYIEIYHSKEPLSFDKRTTGKKRRLGIGDNWGELFDCAWFHFTGKVPSQAQGKHLVALLDVNGEMCIYDQDARPVRGLTNRSSQFDYTLGQPLKHVYELNSKAKAGSKIDIWADCGLNDLFGMFKEHGRIKQAQVAIQRDDIRQLMYDWEMLLDLHNCLDKKSARQNKIHSALLKARFCLTNPDAKNIAEARAILAPALKQKNGDSDLTITSVGHAHLDLAWLWPIRESRRKAIRTFATAIHLMEKYPEYIFTQSQAQQFLWLKEDEPALYKKVKKKIKEGRIEFLGAMWAEPDVNVTSGESIIRQILHGQRFWQQEYDMEAVEVWLPDTFGYSAAIPQICKKSGIDYFCTQKLAWSLVDEYPHHSFHWKGIDGTAVLTHLLPDNVYNSSALPHRIKGIEHNYSDSDVSSHTLCCYGIGDGGGGPGAEHLERMQRIGNLSGLPTCKQQTVKKFWKEWRKESDDFVTWHGELYLERHQGTLTTIAKAKKYNRQLEFSLRHVEILSTAANKLCGLSYPREALDRLWKDTLLYQFHDILPGSSIKRVYDELFPACEKLLRELKHIATAAENALNAQVDCSSVKNPLIVRNPVNAQRNEIIEYKGKLYAVSVPALGHSVISSTDNTALPSLSCNKQGMENEFLLVKISKHGFITSLFDKIQQREFIDGDLPQLTVYPECGNAWDLPLHHQNLNQRSLHLQSLHASIINGEAVIDIAWQIEESWMKQQIVLGAASKRLEFRCHGDWNLANHALRAQFPTTIVSYSATCDIQFGHVRRPTHSNTTWDMAKEEVCAQQWLDLSDASCGIALLNDCKYGHLLKDNILDLHLLRSAPYPNTTLGEKKPGDRYDHRYGDMGAFSFQYALYPHSGNLQNSDVDREAECFNQPLSVHKAKKQTGPVKNPIPSSLLSIDHPYVSISAVKLAEDDDRIIIRLYENNGGNADCILRCDLPYTSVSNVDMMERPLKNGKAAGLKKTKDGVQLQLKPFEVRTIALM
ncbi:MAG: alpha-mannosidase [Planctomycetes bacterium]|nr:alpha-mannosidase [Planctomycetota bacterium]